MLDIKVGVRLSLIEEGIVLLLLHHGRKGAMARTNQRFCRQRKNLLADTLFQQLRGLKARRQRTGKNCVTHDGDVRGVLRPGADHVTDAVLGVARSRSIHDAEAAKMDEIIWPITMWRWRAFRVRVQMNLCEFFAELAQCRDVVFMCVREKEVFQYEAVLRDEVDNRPRLPT